MACVPRSNLWGQQGKLIGKESKWPWNNILYNLIVDLFQRNPGAIFQSSAIFRSNLACGNVHIYIKLQQSHESVSYSLSIVYLNCKFNPVLRGNLCRPWRTVGGEGGGLISLRRGIAKSGGLPFFLYVLTSQRSIVFLSYLAPLTPPDWTVFMFTLGRQVSRRQILHSRCCREHHLHVLELNCHLSMANMQYAKMLQSPATVDRNRCWVAFSLMAL